MKFYNIYYESGVRVDGQITNRKLEDVHSYIDFGDGRVSKFVYANLEGVKKKAENEDRFDVVVKEFSKGDCVSIHLIVIPKREELSELGKLIDKLLDEMQKNLNELKKESKSDDDEDMVD